MRTERSIARRIAVLGAFAAALTALVSASVPFAVLAIRLNAADARAVDHLARSTEAALQRERKEESSFARAARDVLDETALDQARIEVWTPEGLVAQAGPGRPLGPGTSPTDATPHRERSRMVVRRPMASGALVAVALPISFSPALRREMAWAVVLVVLPLCLAAAAVTVRLVRRALRPLETLAAEVASRRPSRSWESVSTPSADAEITHLADAFNETGARMTAALSAERDFAAYAAHALRTPLTRLSVLTTASPPAVRRAVATLQRLVDSLLVVVRTGTRPRENGATLNVADLVRQVAAARLDESHPLRAVAPDETLVRGDEDLLLAAIEHLVDNALAYAPHGTPVDLVAEAADGSVTIAVVDEGPGLAEGEAERVFEAFFRGHAGSSADGSGLGLALVRRIAEAHGGKARAVRAGGGTRFEIVLPAWRPR